LAINPYFVSGAISHRVALSKNTRSTKLSAVRLPGYNLAVGRDVVSENPVGIIPIALVASLAIGGVSAIFVARKYREHKLKQIILNHKDKVRAVRDVILRHQIERLKGLVGFGASFGDSKAPEITYARGWIPVVEKPDFWYAPPEVPD